MTRLSWHWAPKIGRACEFLVVAESSPWWRAGLSTRALACRRGYELTQLAMNHPSAQIGNTRCNLFGEEPQALVIPGRIV